MVRMVLAGLMALWLSGCATVAQTNHGQPVVFPAELKSQLQGKRIAISEEYKGDCYAPAGNERASTDAAWAPAQLIPTDQIGNDDYRIEYIFWGCEQLQGEPTRRHMFNYLMTSLTFLIVPTHFERYSNLKARVYKGSKLVYEGKYREETRHNLFGVVAIPIALVRSMLPTPVKESTDMTIYRNLTRKFAADVTSEYVFE